jgi:hypothetical protein
MNMRRTALALTLAASLLGLQANATDQTAMHMHKSEMDHAQPDDAAAVEYKDEATVLREKAESHRKLAELYRSRTPVKGSGNYATVAQHCDKLAALYDDAAKEAQAVSSELAK